MTFTKAVREIIKSTSAPVTPQEIRELIKKNYPQYYGTASHVRNVEKGYYKNLDHAVLAQIYSLVRNSNSFFCDRNHEPMKISLINDKTESNPLSDNLTNHDAIYEPRRKIYAKAREAAKTMRNEDDLIKNIEHYYQRSLAVLQEFGGPSIYFHVQAIKEQTTNFLSDRHIEMIYAMLASWGMHKMGDPDNTKAKMVEFDNFKQSILTQRSRLHQFIALRMESYTEEQYEECLDELHDIYCALKVSISDATIVAHSKTLAHILPNLIPPIDRQYTIRFFTQDNKDFFTNSGKFSSVNLPSGLEDQFMAFKKYSRRIKALFDRCNHQLFSIEKNTFNTSYPKIMDNLIISFVKDVPKPKKKDK